MDSPTRPRRILITPSQYLPNLSKNTFAHRSFLCMKVENNGNKANPSCKCKTNPKPNCCQTGKKKLLDAVKRITQSISRKSEDRSSQDPNCVCIKAKNKYEKNQHFSSCTCDMLDCPYNPENRKQETEAEPEPATVPPPPSVPEEPEVPPKKKRLCCKKKDKVVQKSQDEAFKPDQTTLA